MATWYAVGTGSYTWDSTTTTHWATTSGGAGSAGVPAAGDTVIFDNNSTTGTVITNATVPSLAALTLNTGFTGTVALGAASTITGAITLIQGTLNTAGFACTWGSFISSATGALRTLTLGASSVSLSSTGTAWNTAAFNLVMTGSGTITFTGAGITITTGSSINWSTFSIVINSTGTVRINAPIYITANNFTYAPTAGPANVLLLNIPNNLGNGLQALSTMTITGGAAPNRVRVQSGAVGTQAQMSAGTVVASYANFQDIAAVTSVGYPATWNLAAATGGSGDCGGNSGITFTTAQTNYWKATVAGLFSAAGNWYLATNGGGGAGRVPLPQDTAIFDANSGAFTCSFDTGDFGNLTATGTVATLGFNTRIVNCYGNVALGGTVTGIFQVNFAGRGAQTLTNNGVAFAPPMLFASYNGSYTLADNLNCTGAGGISLLYGTFNANGHNVTCASFSSTIAYPRTLLMGTGTWTLTGSGTVWYVLATSLTSTTATANITLTDTTTTAKVFAGAGLTYGLLTLASVNPGGVTITGANTFYDIFSGTETQLTLPSSSITTILNTASTFGPGGGGANYGYQYLHGVSGNWVSTPSSAPLNITSDIDLRVAVAMDSWTPAATQMLLAKCAVIAGSYSYTLAINSSGQPVLTISTNGTTQVVATATAATGFTAGTLHWVRATWSQSGSLATFYTSADGVSWTALGTTVTLTAASIFVSTSALEIGSYVGGTTSLASGKFYRAQVYQGIGGTLVFDANFTNKTPFPSNSFRDASTNNALISITGNAAQAGDGRLLINSSIPGTAATLFLANGNVNLKNASIQDNLATGGANFLLSPTLGLIVSNVSGWGNTPTPATPLDTLTINDYEVVPQTSFTYSAEVIISYGANQTVVSPQATSNPASITTTNWWQIDPTNPTTAINAQVIAWNPQVTEQSAAHLVLGQGPPNVVANSMGGMDGTATFETFSAAVYTGLQQILQGQATVFVQSPWGSTDTGYVRFGPQTGGSSGGSGNKVKDSQLLPSIASAPHRTTSVSWVAQIRPPV